MMPYCDGLSRRQLWERVDTCECVGCQGLRGRYKKDPALLHFYARNLLQRGWAGGVDDVEAAYMMAHAPWYKGAVERGRQTAARTGWGNRVAETGEARTPPAAELH